MLTISRAKPKNTPLHRIPSSDFSTAEEVLKAAALLVEPDDQTQRRAFSKLMPHLYVLRSKGCSYRQLTVMLSQCGFRLQPSTVRDYFNEALATRMDICKAQLDDHLATVADFRSEKNSDLSDIADRISAVKRQQKILTSSKLDDLFGAATVAQDEAVVPVSASVPTAAVVASGAAETGVVSAAGFGLLDLVADKEISSASGAVDGGDVVPVAPLVPPCLTCLPIQEGLTPIQHMALVPAFAREPGDLEHPCIDGLMLNLEQRMSPLALEYTNEKGEIFQEDNREKRFRSMWKKPIPPTISSTDKNFTVMNMALFPPVPLPKTRLD